MDEAPNADRPPNDPVPAGPTAADDSGGTPKIFTKLNGVVAGVTGLALALGTLATATKGFWGSDKPEAQAVAARSADPAPAASAATPAAAAAEEEVPAEEDPSYYDIEDGGTLRYVDGLWIEATAEGKYRYEHISDDGYKTVAVDRGGGEGGVDVWLRWDTAGGQAQKSWDRQATWVDVFNVYPQAAETD